MIENILGSINWVDLLMLAIVIRMVYSGWQGGIVIGLFKLLATLFAVFITLHYFVEVGKFFVFRLHFSKILAETVAFCLLWLVITLVFVIVRDGLVAIFKLRSGGDLDHWGGAVVALFRSLLVCSMTFVLVYVWKADYFVKLARNSLTAPSLEGMAPDLYQWTFEKVCEPFFAGEKLNRRVLKLRSTELEEDAQSARAPAASDPKVRNGFFDRN